MGSQSEVVLVCMCVCMFVMGLWLICMVPFFARATHSASASMMEDSEDRIRWLENESRDIEDG